MEILVPGLILVALMVYASTRIKRSAAKAYEAETVDAGDFVIRKPEGFLNVIGGDPKYAFEAYSREFGGDAAPDFRKATAHVTIRDAGDLHGETADDENVISDINERIGGRAYRVVEAERTDKDVELKIVRKSAEKDGRYIELEVVALKDAAVDFMRSVDEMVLSFEVK